MSEEKKKEAAAHQNTIARLKELQNVNRIASNAINLINDVDIKGAHAGAVAEIVGWLMGFSQSLTGQIKTLESTLPEDLQPKKAAPKLEEVSDAKGTPAPAEPTKKPETEAVKS